jgi:hypothetical protein
MSNFQHPTSKQGVIWIGSKDDTGLTVKAQYNPKELQVDKNIPWQKKNQANQAGPTGLHLEFTGAEGRTMSVELLFDEYEKPNGSVKAAVEALNKMASVINPTSTDENQRRPHLCIASAGAPLRATCTVKLKEADVVSKAADTATGTSSATGGQTT